jgi:hypothetical protein
MAWSEEQYSRAKELVGTIEDAGKRSSLQQGILKYEQSRSKELAASPETPPEQATALKVKGAQQRGMNPQVGAGAIAPTGIEALEQNETFQKGAVGGDDLAEAGRQRWAKEDPLSFAERPSETALGGMPAEPKEVGVELKRGGAGTTSRLIDRERSAGPKMAPLPKLETESGLPSQTGDKTLYRPPEFVPPNLPFSVAMKSRIEFEPSVDQFRAAAGDKLGPRVFDLDENSPEYKAFADQQWAQKYDLATKAGLPITRHQYMNSDDWASKAMSTAISFRDRTESALMGVASGLSLGLGPEAIAAATGQTDELREQIARRPVENLVGNLVGAFNPASGAAHLTAAGTKAGLGQGWKGAAKLGAAVGLAEGAGMGAGRAIGNLATGQEALDEGAILPGVLGAPLGAFGGAAGHGVSVLAGKAVNALRRARPALPVAEAAGVETSALSGVKPSPAIAGYMDEAAKLAEQGLGGTAKTAVQVAAERNAPAVAKAAGSADSALKIKHDSAKLGYHLSPEGQELHPLKNTVAKLGELIGRKSDSLGDPLPMVRSEPFKKVFHDAFTATLMDPDAARVAAATDGGWVMQMDKARELGLLERAVELTPNGRKLPFDPEATARFGPAGRAAAAEAPAAAVPDTGKVLVMVPKRVNAAQLEEIIKSVDEAADVAAGAKASRTKPEAYGELMDAVRRDMHPFKANHVSGTEPVKLANGETVQGYAALRYRQGQELGSKQESFARAGLPERVGSGGWRSLSPADKMKLESELAKFGRRSPAKDKALLGIVDDGYPLRQIAGTRAFQELSGGGDRVPYMSQGSLAREAAQGLLPGRSLRMDPLMRRLAMSADDRGQSEAIRKGLRLPSQYIKGGVSGPSRFEKMVADLSFRGFEKAFREGNDMEAGRITALRNAIKSPRRSGISLGLRGGGLGGRAAAVGGDAAKKRKKK